MPKFKDQDELEKVLEAMDTYGGSFVQGLASLYRRGDIYNKHKLLVAFENYFTEYLHIVRQQESKN